MVGWKGLAHRSRTSPTNTGDLPRTHVFAGPARRCAGTEALSGSAGTSGLLGGCGPPVRHRGSQGHAAAPCGSDVERALDFLRVQQGQPHIPLACPVLAGSLSRFSEHRGARGDATPREGAQELHGEEALSDDTRVVGAGGQLLAHIAAFGEADTVHEDQVGLQGQGHSWRQVVDPLRNTCGGGKGETK